MNNCFINPKSSCFQEALEVDNKLRNINPNGNKYPEELIKELDYFIKEREDYYCLECTELIDYNLRKKYINLLLKY